MGKLRALILFPLLICSALTVQAQTTLQVGTPIERTLGPGQTQEFAVTAEENSYIELVAEQRGIDVLVRVSSPGGKNLGEYDTPNGPEGPELVSFVATAAGSYRITVSPLDSADQTTGSFEIKLLEVRPATDQELKANKNLQEVKAKGIALLAEIEPAIQEIKSPHNRIQAQLKAAQLLREIDEKRADRFMSNAIAGIKEFFATADLESEEYMQQYQWIAQLREELIRVLAERDPDAALNFLQSTTPRYSPYHSNSHELWMQESLLELSIANQIALKDPNRSAQIVRRSLKQGYSYNLVVTLSYLAPKNPELAAELIHEITGKLLNEEKLINNIEAAGLAISLLQSYHTPQEGAQETRRVASPFSSGWLSEDEYKQLLRKALDEVLSYTPRGNAHYASDGIWNMIPGLQSIATEMDRAISGSKAELDKKVAEITNASNVVVNPAQEYQNAIGSSPVEAALETIEKAPAEFQEQLYVQLANREATNGDLARARQIANDHITNPQQRRQALANVDQQETYRALGKGKVEEALKAVSKLRNPRERAAQMSQLVNQIGQGQKRAAALSLLEQARALLNPSPQAQDSDQMNALFELARAFSHYDTKRSFEIVDPLVDQFNDICAAARTMEGFGGENFDGDELNMQNGNVVANILSQMSIALGDLALTNFDRTKAISERIRLPEARLKVYLEIAEHTIQSGR